MFPISADNSIDSALQPIADEIEQRTPGLYVVAAQQYRYPVDQTEMVVTISEPRRFNILEEFIMRAALELNPPPAINDLADAFGLDPVFLEKTFRNLLGLNAVSLVDGTTISLTELGRTFYAEGQVPQPPKYERAYFHYDYMSSTVSAGSTALKSVDSSLAELSDIIGLTNTTAQVATLSLEDKRTILSRALPSLHMPQEGKVVTSIQAASPTSQIWQQVSLFLLYDELEQHWALQARKGKSISTGAQQLLDQVVEKGQQQLLDLFGMDLPDDCESASEEEGASKFDDAERFARIKELARESMRQERTANDSPEIPATEPVENNQVGNVKVLRNEMIRPEFNKLLNSARREVIVFSPWITEQVVDAEFISMLQALALRNVWVLIGHGISRSREKEDRPIPEAALKKIHSIRSPQGVPVARVVWLGGSHAKEVVVDGKVYLHGSFNWLSYRGDKGVRRETISRITIPDIVADARAEYSELFLDRALELWQEMGETTTTEELQSVLSIMGAMSKETELLEMIKTANRFDLFPDWIRIVSNNLVHGDIVHGAICLTEAADLFVDLLSRSSIVPDFSTEWKKALQQVYHKDSGLAYDLVNHPSWEHYVDLGLARYGETPESYLAALRKPQPQVITKKNKKKKR